MNDHTNTPMPEDALLTAYALGELDPLSDEYKTIAAKAADDPALQARIDQIAALGSQLSESYDQAAGPGLDDAALNNLVNLSDAPIARIRRKASLTRRLLPYAGVAACAALATAGVFLLAQPNTPSDRIAGDDPAQLETDSAPGDPAKHKIDQLITIKLDQTPLVEALPQIAQAAGMTINYDVDDVFDPAELIQVVRHPISLDLTDAPARAALESALTQVNAPYPPTGYTLDYHVTDSANIRVDKREALSSAGLPPVMGTALAAIPLEQRLERIRTQLQTPVTLNIDSFPLAVALHQIKEQTGVQQLINWPSLELVGVDPDTLISIRLENIPAQEVLKAVLQQASYDAFDDDKAGIRLHENYVQIDTLRSLKGDVETRIYDINHLITQQTLLTKLKGDLFRNLYLDEYKDDFDIVAQANSGGALFGGGAALFGDGFDSGHRFSLDGLASTGGRTNGVYDIRDLNVDAPQFSRAPGFDLNDALSNSSSGGSGGGIGGDGQGGLFGDDSDSEEESGPRTLAGEPLTFQQEAILADRQERTDEIDYMITNVVGNPDEWLDEESTINQLDGKLAIKTTPENHQAIQDLLDKLAPAGKEIQPEDIEALAKDVVDDVEKALIAIEQRREIREIERERRERFAELSDNPFKIAEHEPLSTFSVDVDTASYAYGRRAILQNKTLPNPNSIRIEEWINYFDYGYTAPVVDPDLLPNGRLTTAALEKLEAADQAFAPFTTDVEVAHCPWAEGHQLVRIGIKAMEVAQTERSPAHLVFLLDVSGSMNSGDKLGLVQRGMPMLLDQLNDNDKVSIVVYAGASGLVLEAAEASDKNKIKEAIASLRAGGSTAGAAGIKLAYEMAEKHFIEGGVNRVILCTDGDFNVGTSNTDELVELVTSKANPEGDNKDKGVYLSVMGFGTGNLNDAMMEKVTNAGNGNYHYIDSVDEAVKTMSQQAGGTLITVAKDVKLQLEFNPARVASYRLIGYENRVLRDEDFNNDTVDAGDIGAGHSVTALYEIVPVPVQQNKPAAEQPDIDELRYQKPRGLAEAADLPELLTVKLRYKPVDAAAEQGTSRKVVKHVPAEAVGFAKASEATRFTASVAAMGMILRGSPHKGDATTRWVVDTAQAAKENDPNGYRDEFVRIATQAGLLEMQRDEAFRNDLVD
ncbi:MAG: von Willebrand factor type A domain-containing protein [Planctomycetota bacterium]